jgi:excisionase family DNA binding protein
MLQVMDQKIFTIPELAELLGKSERTILRWCREGQLRESRLDGSPVIKESALAEFIKDVEP